MVLLDDALEDLQFLARRYEELPELNHAVHRESLDIAIMAVMEKMKVNDAAIGKTIGE